MTSDLGPRQIGVPFAKRVRFALRFRLASSTRVCRPPTTPQERVRGPNPAILFLLILELIGDFELMSEPIVFVSSSSSSKMVSTRIEISLRTGLATFNLDVEGGHFPWVLGAQKTRL